ncbi:hypothetical protein CHARACLAT_023765 [Characodon lateralis]|uniref:Uncharacterized protein n=1 Tax=Characodon lateralis TaxID=208331 RepID=A0ABU7D0W9_9TELE|nr:hypothetical protein [Characodon lateralis]
MINENMLKVHSYWRHLVSKRCKQQAAELQILTPAGNLPALAATGAAFLRSGLSSLSLLPVPGSSCPSLTLQPLNKLPKRFSVLWVFLLYVGQVGH